MKKDVKPGTGETLDSIKDIRLLQAKNGYRFSIDALLLENFISARRIEKAIELGAGSGVVSILLARRMGSAKIVAVEIQGPLAERARKNVKINGLEDRIDIVTKDMKELKKDFPPHTFNIAFSNPPFRKPETGRMSVDEERAVARHEIEITLPDLIKTAAYMLKHAGRFYVIYHPFRLTELIEILRKSRLEPKRMRFVHSFSGEEAKMVLIEAVKGSGTWLTIEPPLYLYEKGTTYSREVKAILER